MVSGRAEFNKKLFDDSVRGNVSRGGFFPNFGGTFGSDLANKAGGYGNLNEQQKRDIYEVDFLSGFQKRPNDAFFEGNLRGAVSTLARDRVANPNENLSLNDRLEKQFSIINSFASSDEERAIANRKIIGLTQGANPNELSGRVREQAAQAREREADRLEKAETEANKQRESQLKVSEQIRDEIKKLNQIAESQGFAGVIEIIDKTNGGTNIKKDAAPTQADTAAAYGEYQGALR